MRAKLHKKTALLVTDDPAVETTVQSVAGRLGHSLRLLQTTRDAMCVVSDSWASEAFVILDLDGRTGRRSLLNTAGGMLSVITLAREEKPWLKSMVRHRRIDASLVKPVTTDALTEAIERVHNVDGVAEDFPGQLSSRSSAVKSVFEKDFDESLRCALRRHAQEAASRGLL